MFLTRRINYTKKLKAHVANGITLLNLCFGILAIIFIAHEVHHYGVLFIFGAAFFDRFDGIVARKFNAESDFGKELDSLCDLVSFGIAPGLLIYETALYKLPSVGMLLAVLYIVCGAVRLARYNIKEFDGVFTGVPITVAGFIIALTFFLIPYVSVGIIALIVGVLTILMVSNVKIAKM